MESGLGQLQTRLRPGRAIWTCRDIADLLARASSLQVIGQIPARCRSATSLGPVCDQDSVMEFGFKGEQISGRGFNPSWIHAQNH